MKLFFANFGFEHQLGPAGGEGMPRHLEQLNSELAATLALLANDGDFIYSKSSYGDFTQHLFQSGLPSIQFTTGEGLPKGIELTPWGWTNELREWAREHEWTCRAPDQLAVQAVNSRQFSFALEEEWGTGLPGAREVRSLEDVQAAVSQLPDGSAGGVVKAEFGMAARERVFVRPHHVDATAEVWISRALETSRALYFEPWVERVAEVGLQFTIPEFGEPVLEGMTPLYCDSRGQYRGSRFADSAPLAEDWKEAIEICRRAALCAQQRGYFGPMGIDAMRYRDAAGVERARPLQDINARLTMGRVSLGLRRLLRPGEVGSWLHLRNPSKTIEETENWYDALTADLADGARLSRTSPLQVSNIPVRHATVAVIAQNLETLERIEHSLFANERDRRGEPRA